MNFDCLNKMIKYIEDNLDEKIDFNKISNITNTNLFILERIFMFLTNMTLVEYIKKRRLSKAFEEIRNTDKKIIDIAFKYQYNSATSFNRAFKKLFNITPSECRKGVGDYKIFPIEYFNANNKKYNFDYEVKLIEDIDIYCFHISSKNHSDFLYKIRELYKEIKEQDYYEIFNKNGMYGVSIKEKNLFHYYLGSKKFFPSLEKYRINKNKYVVFELPSRNQKDIVDLENKIDNQWLPSTNYNKKYNFKIEYYTLEKCYIYLPIE